MSNKKPVAAQKKAPGKAGSQGGKGHQPFPGAIGRRRMIRTPSAGLLLVAPARSHELRVLRQTFLSVARQQAQGKTKRPARIHAGGKCASWCGLSHTHHVVRLLCSLREAGRIWQSSKWVKGGFPRRAKASQSQQKQPLRWIFQRRIPRRCSGISGPRIIMYRRFLVGWATKPKKLESVIWAGFAKQCPTSWQETTVALRSDRRAVPGATIE